MGPRWLLQTMLEPPAPATGLGGHTWSDQTTKASATLSPGRQQVGSAPVDLWKSCEPDETRTAPSGFEMMLSCRNIARMRAYTLPPQDMLVLQPPYPGARFWHSRRTQPRCLCYVKTDIAPAGARTPSASAALAAQQITSARVWQRMCPQVCSPQAPRHLWSQVPQGRCDVLGLPLCVIACACIPLHCQCACHGAGWCLLQGV